MIRLTKIDVLNIYRLRFCRQSSRQSMIKRGGIIVCFLTASQAKEHGKVELERLQSKNQNKNWCKSYSTLALFVFKPLIICLLKSARTVLSTVLKCFSSPQTSKNLIKSYQISSNPGAGWCWAEVELMGSQSWIDGLAGPGRRRARVGLMLRKNWCRLWPWWNTDAKGIGDPSVSRDHSATVEWSFGHGRMIVRPWPNEDSSNRSVRSLPDEGSVFIRYVICFCALFRVPPREAERILLRHGDA